MMVEIKEILNAIKHLAFFIPDYTFYPRWIEVGYGIMFWYGIIMIMYSIWI